MRVAVVGGGIVGLSVAISALESGAEHVTIFDKEKTPGFHASSRNSGVLHSGIYYDSESLKANFSIQGNIELRKLCHDNEIELLEKGKLIVSTGEQSENYLYELMKRAEKNGVPAERLQKSELDKYEPRAKTHESFIYVKTTAVAEPSEVTEALVRKYELLGGNWNFSHDVSSLSQLTSGNSPVRQAFDFAVNCAGSGALEMSRKEGIGKDFALTPFLGVYWATDGNNAPLRMPIYPTPHEINPFLGVHLTPTISGLTKIGPTAIPVLGREQYSLTKGLKVSDSFESIKAFMRILRGSKHSLRTMIASELPKFLRYRVISEAAELYEGLEEVKSWIPKPGGIRAQLVNKEGELVQDFVIEKRGNHIHVLNAVSPGWTSALPFGRWIVENYLMKEKSE